MYVKIFYTCIKTQGKKITWNLNLFFQKMHWVVLQMLALLTGG